MIPTFIACTARSGSTLLRWLIDSHPDVACPSETDVAQLLCAFDRTEYAFGGPEIRSLAARRAVEDMVSTHLDGKVWVDKSMSNALNLDLLAKTWSSARFIFLHRHVMDFIASALEAEPWGLSDYGFAPYAAQSPGDNVGALARYWLERTTRMLDFGRRTGHPTMTLRYEDLVASPTEALRRVWNLLEVPCPPQGPEGAFEAPHDAHGAADHRIWYTSSVEAPSDRASRILPGRISGQLRVDVNLALGQLGYPVINDRWGADSGVVVEIDGQTVAVDIDAVEGIVSGRLNIGDALRSRRVRYYGTPLATYGEEREVFGQLPKLLGDI